MYHNRNYSIQWNISPHIIEIYENREMDHGKFFLVKAEEKTDFFSPFVNMPWNDQNNKFCNLQYSDWPFFTVAWEPLYMVSTKCNCLEMGNRVVGILRASTKFDFTRKSTT